MVEKLMMGVMERLPQLRERWRRWKCLEARATAGSGFMGSGAPGTSHDQLTRTADDDEQTVVVKHAALRRGQAADGGGTKKAAKKKAAKKATKKKAAKARVPARGKRRVSLR